MLGVYPKLPSCYSKELADVVGSLLKVNPALRPTCGILRL